MGIHNMMYYFNLCVAILVVFQVSFRTGTSQRVWCLEEKIEDATYGNLTFPRTLAKKEGNEFKNECPKGFRNDGRQNIYEESSVIERKALSGAYKTCHLVTPEHSDENPYAEWNNVSFLDCRTVNSVESEAMIHRYLESLTPELFKQIYAQLSIFVYFSINDYDCAETFLIGISKLLTAPELTGPNGLSPADRQTLFALVHSFTTQVIEALPAGFKFQVGNSDILIETARFYGYIHYAALRNTNPYLAQSNELKFYTTKFNFMDNIAISVNISTEALQMSMDQVPHAEPQLKISVFSDKLLQFLEDDDDNNFALYLRSDEGESDEGLNYTHSCYLSDDEVPTNRSVDKPQQCGLITIDLLGAIQNLSQPVTFTIQGKPIPEGFQPYCVYWDTETSQWSTEGIVSYPLANGVRCSSSHLTAFSALLEPLPLPFPNAEYAPINNSMHAFILSILSSIGSICSIIGLSFTVLTYTLFRSLRRERSNRILINLSSSLLFMHIMSLCGSKSLWDGHCMVPAVSLHYLVLTSLSWMTVEAVHMFEVLISVFIRPETRFLMKRLVLAWGTPLIVVTICAIVEPHVYTVGRADLCLMSAHANIVLYYVAYIVPICMMLFVNLIIFSKIFRVLYQQTRRTKAMSRGSANPKYYFVKISPSQIKGSVSIAVLVGLGWILGLLAVGPFEVFFRYMYCVCNAGQGAFIFIFRVLLNPHACKQWKKVIIGLSSDSSLDVSFTTSSSNADGKEAKRKSTVISQTFISASNSAENSLTPSNPLSATLATTLASILRSEDERAANGIVLDKKN